VASKLVFIAGLAIVPAGLAGCFTGADAKGLPCNADLDCGVDDRCIDGFCGGPPATTTTTDPTTESSSSSMTVTDPSTGELPCDNPAAQCEPLVPGMPDADCDADCTLPTCGDGVYNPHALNDGVEPPSGVEECDEGFQGMQLDHGDCDRDCTLVACGDLLFNAEAEPCDDGNGDDFDGCTVSCQIPALAERFDTQVWTTVPYDLSSYDGDPEWGDTGGVNTAGWMWNGSAWTSGAIPYFGVQKEVDQRNYAATTRLVSIPFDLPDTVPTGFRLELRFEHSISIESEGCAQDEGRNGDGGLVRLMDAKSDDVVTPEGGYEDLGGICMGIPRGAANRRNPLDIENGFAFTGEASGPVVIDLTEHLGRQDVQLVFEFGTDCVHCVDEFFSPSVWTIDDVIVAAFPL
jgi:hypothetical protein